jgi:hypothetical protein
MQLRIIASVCVVLAASGFCSAAAPPSLGELRQGIKDAREAIHNFAVACDCSYQTYAISLNRLNAPIREKATYSCDSSFNGRIRYEGTGVMQGVEGKPNWTYQKTGVFDGKRMKLITGTNDKMTHGRVWTQALLEWPIDPRSFLYLHNFHPVDMILGNEAANETEKWRVVGVTKWDGHTVVDIETETMTSKADGNLFRNRYYVDCERGFSIVYRANQMYRPKTKSWLDYCSLTCHDYVEAGPGIWLPTRILYEGYGIPIADNDAYMINRTEVKASNWVVNANLPDTLFDIDFPSGLIVEDQETGKIYQTVNIEDGKVQGQIIQGLEIYRDQKNSFWRRSLLLWGSGFVGLCVVLGVLWWYRRGRRAVAPNVTLP